MNGSIKTWGRIGFGLAIAAATVLSSNAARAQRPLISNLTGTGAEALGELGNLGSETEVFNSPGVTDAAEGLPTSIFNDVYLPALSEFANAPGADIPAIQTGLGLPVTGTPEAAPAPAPAAAPAVAPTPAASPLAPVVVPDLPVLPTPIAE